MTKHMPVNPDGADDSDDGHAGQSTAALILGSIGVVYGDIGTSPLYALRESLAHSVKADAMTEEAVIGAISLLIFALLFTVTLKYVLFLMRADNRGEGGTLSLMALAESCVGGRSLTIFLLGVAGAALFSGDAIITPAISVMSAIEGLSLVTDRLERICDPDHACDPDHSVLGSKPRHGAGRGAVRPDHGRLFRRHRRTRRHAYRRRAAGALGLRSALRSRLPAGTWLARLRRARLGLSRRNGRRGALCRHGPFRTVPDSGGLARLRPAGPAAELSGTGRAASSHAPRRSTIPFSCSRPTGRCCRSSSSRPWRQWSPARR